MQRMDSNDPSRIEVFGQFEDPFFCVLIDGALVNNRMDPGMLDAIREASANFFSRAATRIKNAFVLHSVSPPCSECHLP